MSANGTAAVEFAVIRAGIGPKRSWTITALRPYLRLGRSVDQALQLAAVDQGGDDTFVGDAEARGQIGDVSGFVQGTPAAQIGGQSADESIAGSGVVDRSGLVGWEVLVIAGSDQGAAALAQGDDDLAHPAVDELLRLVHHGSWPWYQGVQLVEIRDQDVD